MIRIEVMQIFFNGVFVALLFIGREDNKETLEEAYIITRNHYTSQPIYRCKLNELKEWVDSL